ncbi:AAA family ATPase [Aldersonia sp. NBC_00410]|uniref:AAA family ATPase n=1 Tax=Aldersonia sp. NBC_00410 TaxID=2975954 RepID=UPI002256F7CB|nr:AAA family ATPase [Aldersonia sp. NBC_00410]MCX5042360.1 AAA family ATPase [Aldersonia sp. NBC_00410]
MAIGVGEYEVTGATVGGVGPLSDPVHIEFNAGVSALYGLNGAGKSWILSQINSAATGVLRDGGYAFLHIRVLDPQASPTSFPLGQVVAGLRKTIAKQHGQLGSWVDNMTDEHELIEADPEWDTRSETEQENMLAELRINKKMGFEPFGEKLKSTVEILLTTMEVDTSAEGAYFEAASQGRLSLQATGSRDKPSWRVWLSGVAHEGEEWQKMLREVSNLEYEADDDPIAPDLPAHKRHLPRDGSIRPSDFTHQIAYGYVSQELLYSFFQPSRLTRSKGGPRNPAHSLWPDWLQIPAIVVVDEINFALLHQLGKDEKEYDEETLDYALRRFPNALHDSYSKGKDSILIDHTYLEYVEAAPVSATNADTTEFHPTMLSLVNEIERRTNGVFQDMIDRAPELRYELGNVDSWFRGRRPRWLFNARGNWLPLDNLSSAQLRWAQLAVRVATSYSGNLFLCDEPERGLHKHAERRIPTGLAALAAREDVAVLVATHSTHMLADSQVTPLHVHQRGSGATAVKPLSLSMVDRLSAEVSSTELGVAVADLFSLLRIAVVVEGRHDELVFSNLLRDQLDHAPATILPMHGAKSAVSLAEARLLFDGTDADIILVLDNLRNDRINRDWQRIIDFVQVGELDQARSAVDTLKDGGKTAEALFLHQLALRALETGRLDRIHVFGLSQPDVICYLPVDRILARTNKDWPNLTAAWKRESAGFKNGPVDIKKWLVGRKLISSDHNQLTQAIEDAAISTRKAQTPLHPDLCVLGDLIRALGQHSQVDSPWRCDPPWARA